MSKFINKKDKFGYTALHVAARYATAERLDIINFLISAGANLFIKDNDGNNAFDLC